MKKETRTQKKVRKVMKEFKQGQLHSGSPDGPAVQSRKQALAIAISESKKKDRRK